MVIVMDILAALLDGPKLPTRLAQICNLSYDNFTKFASVLQSRNLVRKSLDQCHEVYSINPDGIQLQQDYRKVSERLRL